MNVTSIGDMAQSLMLRARSSALKSSINTLSDELASGYASDVTGRLGGDFSYLSDIEYNISRLKGFSVAASEASLFAAAAQQGLDRMQGVATTLGGELLEINPVNLDTVRHHISDQARQGLETVLSALNGSAGGRAVFAGVATDVSPMNSGDTLITALKSEVSGMVLTSDILQAVDDWFADGGGFGAVMYSGSDQSLAPVRIGNGEQITMSLQADDPRFRETLRNTALAVLATDPDLALDRDAQNALLHIAGEGLLSNETDLIGLRADFGYSEARIEESRSRNAAALTSLEISRTELLAADPYETASRLEKAQFQLESLYAVTVRSSRLSLLSFLR